MPRDPIMDKIRISATDESLVRKGDKVLLSMSAGKDSVALFHMMRDLSGEMDLTLGAFHLNHGTRGGDSDADEIFVRDLCAEFGCQFHPRKEKFNLAEPSFEKRARARRYALLEALAGEEKYDRIMTAHTKSDQAETVLMRIFTGTHISGLCSIPEVRGRIVRPLLSCSSDEIVSYLMRNGYRWREDESNRDVHYARNFIRHKIIPLAESRFSRARDTIAEIATAASENMTLVDEMAGMCGMKFGRTDSAGWIDFGRRGISRMIFNWGAAKLFSVRNIYVSRERLDEAWKRFQTESRFAILFEEEKTILEKDSRGGTLVLRMRIRRDSCGLPENETDIPVTKNGFPRQTVRIAGFAFNVYEASYEEFLRTRGERNILFLGINEDEELRYRSFTPGDRMLVNGSYKKLKYLMNENKCTGEEKRSIPVLIAGGRIAAIPFSFFNRGFDRIADDRLVKASSKKILAICHTHIENER